MISIIVPVYNTEKYLDRCIQSILAQTYPDFELLLINDGSTDSSGAICDKYAKQDIRVRVFHKENGGVSSARNKGLDNAQGEWVSFVDSDDWINSSMLEEVYYQAKNTKAEMVFVDINICKSHNVNQYYETYRFAEVPHKALKNYLKESRLRPGWGLIKKTLIENNGYRFPENLTIYEDMYMMIRLVYKANFVANVEKPLYNYYMQDSSIIHATRQERIQKDQIWAYNAILEFFRENETYDLYAPSLFERILFDYQKYALDPLLHSVFLKIYPEKKYYIWQSSRINLKLKIIMWCLTHNMTGIAHWLCVTRNFILRSR